jgi:hypothetical protein
MALGKATALTHATVRLTGRRGVVDIDGRDISRACRSVTVTGLAGEVPVVTVELLLTGTVSTDVEGGAAMVGPETSAALLALGWTPPDVEAEA